jgi:hypothetical protein
MHTSSETKLHFSNAFFHFHSWTILTLGSREEAANDPGVDPCRQCQITGLYRSFTMDICHITNSPCINQLSKILASTVLVNSCT